MGYNKHIMYYLVTRYSNVITFSVTHSVRASSISCNLSNTDLVNVRITRFVFLIALLTLANCKPKSRNDRGVVQSWRVCEPVKTGLLDSCVQTL